ncbi:MAG: hypothetical protein HY720_27190 [Planctomycetes bacterium]|nr:hypothetical protein [Planctomycetota bacterium]
MRDLLRALPLVTLSLVALPSCAAQEDSVTFSVSPVDLEHVREIVPLGNLNPPGHTFPTDHVYFYLDDPERPRDVVAPAAGEVAWIHSFEEADAKIVVRATASSYYYVGHVAPDPEIRAGRTVAAGDRLGTTSGRSYALDLGAVDERLTLSGFVRPERYPADTVHCVSPLALFSGPLRSRVYALVRREGQDKDGRIDIDRPGTLAGNWFLEGLPPGPESFAQENWQKHLAFVRDVHDPGILRVSIGGTIASAGTFAVSGNAPDPTDVRPETGAVVYELLDARFPGACAGRLRVQLLDSDRIHVELFPANNPADQFGAGARVYTR